MFPCPKCGEPVPEVIGAEDQRCPHCTVLILPRTPSPPARALLAEGARALALGVPRWWVVWLPFALAFDVALWGFAMGSPDVGRLLASCAGSGAGVAPGPGVVAALLGFLFVSFAVYFAGWAATAAAYADLPRDGPWWRNTVAGSVVLAFLFLVGAVLLVPVFFLFAWFLLAPVAVGLGAGPREALSAAREVGRRRPSTFTLAAFILVLGVEVALILASCAGGFATSLAAQGLVWWLLAPVLPVLTTHAWARLTADES